VEIDPLTFEIRVKGVWAVYDVGRAIDERILRGQIEGGITQGLGWGSMEVMTTKDGVPLQSSFADYIVPTSMDFPEIQSGLVDNPYEHGPSGAKGAGELTFIGAAPALASAVQSALGIPVRGIPVTPERLMEAWRDALSSRR
jgi:CO/xanthine dehydrogenase Mo-binding subunit